MSIVLACYSASLAGGYQALSFSGNTAGLAYALYTSDSSITSTGCAASTTGFSYYKSYSLVTTSLAAPAIAYAPCAGSLCCVIVMCANSAGCAGLKATAKWYATTAVTGSAISVSANSTAGTGKRRLANGEEAPAWGPRARRAEADSPPPPVAAPDLTTTDRFGGRALAGARALQAAPGGAPVSNATAAFWASQVYAPTDFWAVNPLVNKYASCYQFPSIAQGSCGADYAIAAVHALSIALCRAAVDAGVQGANVTVVSPMESLALWLNWDSGDAVNADPCAGGVPEAVLLTYALDVHPQLGAGYNLLTCNGTDAAPCSGGCAPYVAGSCPSLGGGAINPLGTSTAVDPGCASIYFAQQFCYSTGNSTLDAPSKALTDFARGLVAVPSTEDANVSKLTSTGAYSVNAGDRAQSSLKGLWDGSASGAQGWSAADVATVKDYLRKKGPMTVVVTMCQDFLLFLSQGPACGLVGHAMTYYDSALGTCWSTEQFSGGVFEPTFGYYMAPVFPSTALGAYSGASCSANNSIGSRSFTLTGWRTVPDAFGAPVESWVLLASNGNLMGDAGSFYVPVVTASMRGVNASVPGSVELREPFGLSFSRRSPRALVAAAAAEPAARRRLQALAAGAANASVAGAWQDCSADPDMVVVASENARSTMMMSNGVDYSNFVVYQVQCQVVGTFVNIKASVSGQNTVGGVEYDLLTFSYSADAHSDVFPATNQTNTSAPGLAFLNATSARSLEPAHRVLRARFDYASDAAAAAEPAPHAPIRTALAALIARHAAGGGVDAYEASVHPGGARALQAAKAAAVASVGGGDTSLAQLAAVAATISQLDANNVGASASSGAVYDQTPIPAFVGASDPAIANVANPVANAAALTASWATTASVAAVNTTITNLKTLAAAAAAGLIALGVILAAILAAVAAAGAAQRKKHAALAAQVAALEARLAKDAGVALREAPAAPAGVNVATV